MIAISWTYKKDFISGLHGKPDLYGPFWVAVTLCFSTAICGNLANFIQKQGSPDYRYVFFSVANIKKNQFKGLQP